MKVVLSGSTGYIGSELLTHCLNHPSITSVIVLTRRKDPNYLADKPKAKVIVVEDFTSYDEATVDELKTADAALWCLGTSSGNETVDIEFPLTFIKTIKARSIASTDFRYVQLSGALTEPPPKEGESERSLWFFANGRRVRGAMETKILETAEDDNGFSVYLVKPGGVLPQNMSILQKYVFGGSLFIRIDELAATMVDLAVRGNDKRMFSNQEIIKHAREL